jgi:hypothetical protein
MLLMSLNQIQSELQPLYLPNLTNNITDIPIIASALAQTDTQEVRRFYDCKPDTCNWYYQCYCQISTDQPNVHIPVHNYFTKWLDVHEGCGSFLIVKNGPSDGCWPNELNLDLNTVARTIWWYQASGNDQAQVCREQKFTQFIKGL